MKTLLKTATIALSIAALFGSVAVGFAETTDTSSSSSETTNVAPAPPAVVYAAPVVVAPPPICGPRGGCGTCGSRGADHNQRTSLIVIERQLAQWRLQRA